MHKERPLVCRDGVAECAMPSMRCPACGIGHIRLQGSVHVADSSKVHRNTCFASSHMQKDTLQLKACQGTLQGKTRPGVAVSEPEPPAGGFLWDLMDHLWFTGAAPASHLQHRLGMQDARISCNSRSPKRLLVPACPWSANCIPPCPIGAVWWVFGVWVL